MAKTKMKRGRGRPPKALRDQRPQKRPQNPHLLARQEAWAAQGWITVDAAAALCNRSRFTIYTWASRKRIRTMRDGAGQGSVYVQRSDIERLKPPAPPA